MTNKVNKASGHKLRQTKHIKEMQEFNIETTLQQQKGEKEEGEQYLHAKERKLNSCSCLTFTIFYLVIKKEEKKRGINDAFLYQHHNSITKTVRVEKEKGENNIYSKSFQELWGTVLYILLMPCTTFSGLSRL